MSTALRTYFRGADLVTLKDEVRGGKNVYHFDHQGTTQSLTDTATGVVTDTFTSDAWGVPIHATQRNSNWLWYVANSGYYWDANSTRYYVRARYLSPQRGHWLAVDPLVRRDSFSGAYLYGDNHPTRATDPSGLQSVFDSPAGPSHELPPGCHTKPDPPKCEELFKDCPQMTACPIPDGAPPYSGPKFTDFDSAWRNLIKKRGPCKLKKSSDLSYCPWNYGQICIPVHNFYECAHGYKTSIICCTYCDPGSAILGLPPKLVTCCRYSHQLDHPLP